MSQPLFSPMLRLSKSGASNPTVFLLLTGYERLGSHNSKSSISQTCTRIWSRFSLWSQYRDLWRWRMEKIQKTMCTRVLWCAYPCPICYWFFIWRFYFCQRNNRLVWDETIKIMNGLFDEVWAGKDVISLDHTLEITLAVCVYSSLQWSYSPFSLILIFRLLSLSSVLQVIACWLLSRRIFTITGFGQQMSWNEEMIIPKGHRMSMNEALHIVSTGTFFRALFPDWILKFTKRLDSVRVAFEELQVQIAHFTDIDIFFSEHHYPLSIDVYVWNDWWAAEF